MCQSNSSLVPTLHAPSGVKWSGEQSRISWAYYPKWVMTNEIVRLLIITQHFPYNSKICLTPFEYLFLSGLSAKCFERCQVTLSQNACQPKKFNVIHQTVSARERVGSGDQTSLQHGTELYNLCKHIQFKKLLIVCYHPYAILYPNPTLTTP